MNEWNGVKLLFTIVKEFQHAFQTPVILFTPKDYLDDVFQSLVHFRQALIKKAPPERIAEIVNAFHTNWLVTVFEIDEIKKRIKEIPRDVIFKAIDFTKHHTHKRFSKIRKYIDSMKSSMTEGDNKLMRAELRIIKEIQDAHDSALIEKQTYMRSQANQTEFITRVQDEIEELLNWLDRLYNSLAVQFLKHLEIPIEPNDLTKALTDIINEVAVDPNIGTQKVTKFTEKKVKGLTNVLCIGEDSEMEILKVAEKIRSLEDQMSKLQNHNSATVSAYKLKILYLEERLQSLENIHDSMKLLQKRSQDMKHVCIFNHLLPHHDRCQLVKKLVQLWGAAMLSVKDLKELFNDDKGIYHVDKHGRKIYTKSNDHRLYQLNDKNELVPLTDNTKHVFYYDECGRYYLNQIKQRVYKAHEGASEYMMGEHGYLIRISENKDGIDYYYDRLGRYYINEEGHHIYCEENSIEEYENDGLGNLIRIRSQEFYHDPAPKYEMSLAENKYLKEVVGDALKTCIANVVVHQPNDPVAFLADSLVQFRNNITERKKRADEEREMFAVQSFSGSSTPVDNQPAQNMASDYTTIYEGYKGDIESYTTFEGSFSDSF